MKGVYESRVDWRVDWLTINEPIRLLTAHDETPFSTPQLFSFTHDGQKSDGSGVENEIVWCPRRLHHQTIVKRIH